MKILALDTSTLVSSVALAQSDKLLAEVTLQTRKTHSERLMPHIAELLEKAECSKHDLGGIAVSIGPGSFTGLRIGLATGKALSYALKLPLVGVPTMEALAYGCYSPQTVLAPMLDAQKNNVYIALYRWINGKLTEVEAPKVSSVDQTFARLADLESPVILLGEAAVMYRELAEHYPALCLPPAHSIISRAGSVALLGLSRIQQGLFDDVESLEPLYIRRSEAEVLWEKRHGVTP